MDPTTRFFTGIFLMLQMTGTTGSTSRQYHYIDTPMSWTDALHYCQTKYTDLASVDNMDEYLSLVLTLDTTAQGSIWIGLVKKLTDWWIWSDGIGEVTVYEWNIGVEHGDCVVMEPTSYWFANPCSTTRDFLCYDYDSSGKKVYILRAELRTWQDAQSICRQHHIDLVSVTTDAENQAINAAGQGLATWIGLHRDYWTWSDGRNTSFRNWVGNYPENNDDHDCVMISVVDEYKWKDGVCEAPYPFICYGDLKTKKTVMKLRISSEVNLNLPSVSESMLQQIQAGMEEQGVTDFKISWRAVDGEGIFDYQQDKIKVDECVNH